MEEHKCLICGKVLTEQEYKDCGNYCYKHNEQLEEEYFQDMHDK